MREIDLTEISGLNVVQICMDLVSTIWEKKRDDILTRFHALSSIGKFAHFLQSLRRDEDLTISTELLRELAFKHRITLFELNSLIKKGDKYNIGTLSDDEFHIEVRTFEDVINACTEMWNELFANNMVSEDEEGLLKLLYISLTPIRPLNLHRIIKKYSKLKEIIRIAKDLGLLIEREKYFFSPSFLKETDEKTLDLITQYDIGSEDILLAIEKAAKYPGIPLNHMPLKTRQILREGGVLGLLLPASVQLGSSTKEFIFANPKDLKDGDLAYQVAAHIRYNEHYAEGIKGVIRMPIAYLNKLISYGIAGNATNIGWNYRPLEFKGVIKVVPGETSGRFAMMMLKKDPVKKARNILQEGSGSLTFWDRVTEPPEWLNDPAAFRASNVNELQRKRYLKLLKLLRDRG